MGMNGSLPVPGLQAKRQHGWLTWSLPVTQTIWNSAAEMSGFTLLRLLLLAFAFPQNVSWKRLKYPQIALPHGSPVPCGVFRPDANAGADQGASQVQSEDQDPPADPGKPRRTATPEGAEERQRILYSLRLFLLDGCRAPEAGASIIILTNSWQICDFWERYSWFSEASHVFSRHQKIK